MIVGIGSPTSLAIDLAKKFTKGNVNIDSDFGQGESDKIFLKLLDSKNIWSSDCQKQFQDLNKYE
jgi:hypothetical protein